MPDLPSMVTFPTTIPSTVLDPQTVRNPLYKVLLHNDAVNSMDHVVLSLVRVFGFAPAVCERIMLEAHQSGLAHCTVEPLEQAELHRDQLISFLLVSTIELEG
jgi:ATP-dependent Clp protease adaptor protein ClpS